MAAVRQLGDKRVVKVYLLDNSFKTLLMAEDATVEDLVQDMAMKLTFADPQRMAPCFSLHECLDGVTISKVLHPSAKLGDIMGKWPAGDVPRFVYQVKLYMETIKQTTDSKIQYMLYIQGVYSIMTGIYPTTEDEAIALATLQMQAKFGSHRPDVHKPPYLQQQLRGMVPAPLFPKRTPQDWETLILSRHAMLNADAQARPMPLYCAFLAPRDYYGCAFFTVKQKFSGVLPQILIIGASCAGLCLLDRATKNTFEKYSLAQIYRWGFKPGLTFYFQVKTATGGKGPLFEFETIQGHFLSDLLTDYANMILVELGIKPAPGQSAIAATGPAASTPSASSSSSSSGGNSTAPTSAAGGATEGAGQVATPAAPAATSGSVTRMQPHDAALMLQAAFRGNRVRRQLKRHYAAVRIQSIARGYLARGKFDKMLMEMEEQLRAM